MTCDNKRQVVERYLRPQLQSADLGIRNEEYCATANGASDVIYICTENDDFPIDVSRDSVLRMLYDVVIALNEVLNR